MRTGTIVLIALVPALALAAPKAKDKKKAPAKKATPAKPEAPADPAPTPSPDPAKDAKNPPGTPVGGGGGAGSGGNGGGGGSEAKKDEPAEPDVDTLRQEYLTLRDELFKSRARANAVASQIYSTRIQVRLTYASGRYYSPSKSSIRLDGASVYENNDGAIAGDDGIRFNGYVAPGRHLITFRVEATGKDDDTFTSVTETQIVVKAVPGKDLVVAAKAKDSGDISYEWKKKEKGSYGLGIDVSVKTQARAEGDPKGAATSS